MKTQTNTCRFPIRRLIKLALVGVMLLGSALLMAEPRDREESVEDLARQLREALQNDAGAFADMVERAREGGGRLELDMEEFEELLGRGREDGAPMSPDMAEFLREMHSGGDSRVLSKEEALKLLGRDWMDRLGKHQEPGKEMGSSSDAIKNLMRMFGRQMQGRSSGANEREHRSILEEYRPVVETARKRYRWRCFRGAPRWHSGRWSIPLASC